MSLAEELPALLAQARAAIAAAADDEALEAVRIAWLGRNGRLKAASKAFGALSADDKRAVGPLLAELNEGVRTAFNQRRQALAGAREVSPIDITLPASGQRRGSIHPLAQVGREVEEIFTSLGFDIVDGPHVELDEFNFTRLNIPAHHPARDSHDTFWLANGKLLRTHTSSVQARVYAESTPPIRKVVVGRVFRYDEIDATHDNTFTQVEGFLVDEGITCGHLVAVLETLIRAVLRREDIELRLRPSFFPFVEPGFEVDVRCTTGGGRFADWVELLGCGMIHPRVLAMGDIDPERFTGFAFGLGLERLAMIRHGIQDIRLFNGADLRGLRQFAA